MSNYSFAHIILIVLPEILMNFNSSITSNSKQCALTERIKNVKFDLRVFSVQNEALRLERCGGSEKLGYL